MSNDNKLVTLKLLEYFLSKCKDTFVDEDTLGAANGVAQLDENGKLVSDQIPDIADDVIEGYITEDGKFYKESEHTTEIIGETGKLYIDLSDNAYRMYRYSGTAFVLINDVSASIGAVYETTKTSMETSDGDAITAFFAVDGAPKAKAGDVIVVRTVVDGTEYSASAYQTANGTDWVALSGNVDADKVILQEDIVMAGNYTQVGNLSKTQNGTATFSTKGKSVADALLEIFSKRLQPTITANPSIGSFSLTGAGAVEAGTQIQSASYSAASLNAGTYQYGPETGVVATNWVVKRVTDDGSVEVANVNAASLTAGTDNNGGAGFIIGDMGLDDDVASLKYEVTATHGAGVVANDNLGSASNPEVKIAAGTKSKTTAAYTPYRNYFYGATTNKPTIDSAYIRGLTKSNKAYAAGNVTISVPAGATRVCIACIAGKTGVKKVINQTAMNADVTSTFVKSTVSVEGANGYAAKEYNVWTFEPAAAYENAATLVVTLG